MHQLPFEWSAAIRPQAVLLFFAEHPLWAVVLEFPWFTAFGIKVITAERSDAGAEEAADTLEGVTGGGGNGIGKEGGGRNWLGICVGGITLGI